MPMTWDWQLSNFGSQLVYRNVDMLDIDGFNNTTGVVSGIHARAGRTLPHEMAICYISLGSWENFRPDATSWPTAGLGLTLGGYPNEHWVDVRRLSALLPVVDSRLQLCAGKGFDGVEVDNIDGWTNHSGFALTQSDTEAWLAAVANQAHADNLFVIYKNDPLSTFFGVRYFDGALSEQCYAFNECTPSQESGLAGCNDTSNRCGVQVFSDAGKWVGEVEYPSGVCTPSQACTGRRNFTTYCNTTGKLGFGFAAWRADLNLDGQTFYPCS
jgi:endo-alpha-1,4-polygalactosaminidase (GH114 family)